ncbi:hypothetical protein ACIO6U_02530 [Streptomyces sp. NPDC087422]|uniref:hypothetical protein n=1 Tax=Streptomyces sp. NPDC087422 TaxID=3365786 RepID=UPI0038244801
MAKIETLVDSFTTGTINTALWSSVTAGAVAFDTVNCQVSLAHPTTGATNIFGSNNVYDARGSAVYAQVTPAANGNGGTRSIMRVRLDTNNAVTIRLDGGAFRQTLQVAGTLTSVTLPAYDPHLHRWWRLRESGGVFFADTSPDGLTWTNQSSMAYPWDASATLFRFETQATSTEVAGNAMTVAHVGTRTGGQFNNNWPQAEFGAGLFWGANGGTVPRDYYVDITQRTQGSVSVSRGRQYESDQVRSGEEQVTLTNADGLLDPTGTGPYAGHIQPDQPTRVRAQWPPSPNLLSQGIALGGAGVAAGTIVPTIALDLATDTDLSGGSVVNTSSAWMGTSVTQFLVTTNAAPGLRIVHSGQVAVLPGQAYTVQMRVRDVTASTSLQVKPFLGWVGSASQVPSSYTYGSTATLTGSATAGWTYLTVSGTAPAGVYGMDVGVAVATTATANCTIQTDGWQLEKGLTASPWAMPGAWYGWFAGFTGDYASSWSMSGTYGTVGPPAADAFSLLSQQELQDALTMEINSHTPTFLYRLDDPAGVASATDQTGTYPAAPVVAGKNGAGAWSFGNAITATSPSGVYTGSTGTVATVANAGSGSGAANAATFLSLTQAGIKGPQTSPYSRMIAFRYTGPTPTTETDLWVALDNRHAQNPSGQLRLFINSAGKVNLFTSSFAVGGATLTSTASVLDGNWHLAVFGNQAGGAGTVFLSLDGSYTSSASGISVFPRDVVSDSVAAFVDGANGNYTSNTFSGSISFVGEFPSILTGTDCTNLYTAWSAACAGESTDARYARILRYAGYTGPTSIQSGLTTSMGPAAIDGQDAVTALGDVVTTENGAHFVDGSGGVTFLSRAARYNAFAPAVTFGERTDLGEWPYEDLKPVYDSTHLGNVVTFTQASTGQTFNARDAASIAAHFPKTITRTVNASSALEVQDAAAYALSRYKAPVNRISSLVLHPAANPAMWAMCLSLELGTRVRVMRRPPGVAAIQVDCFVENLAWSWDDKADATLTLQCSPADLTPYARFAAWHTTAASSIATGATSITVKASQDNTNPLSTQLFAGQQLKLEPGVVNAETVTVAAVGATSPGWTTAVITLTAPTVKAHAAGTVVCELLPAGFTDPTTWDSVSQFDATVFAY